MAHAVITNAKALFDVWVAAPRKHLLIELADRGFNRHLLEDGSLCPERALASATALSRREGRRVILGIGSQYFFIQNGSVIGALDLGEDDE